MTNEAKAVRSATDAELVSRIAAGDESAFESLMRQFNQLLYRTARSILRDDFDAEDAVQNAYLLAYRNIAKFRGDAKLSTWLVRIVVNESLRHLRKRGGSGQVVSLADDDYIDAIDSAYRSISVRPERPDELAMRSDLRRLLEREIDSLPLPRRAVFMLRAVDELSVSETAQALEIPEATVRTRFFRARMELAAALAPEAPPEFGSAHAFAGERCNRIVRSVLAQIVQQREHCCSF